MDAACSMQNKNVQPTCADPSPTHRRPIADPSHTTYNMRHATCIVQHASSSSSVVMPSSARQHAIISRVSHAGPAAPNAVRIAGGAVRVCVAVPAGGYRGIALPHHSQMYRQASGPGVDGTCAY
jgi:hypothetical protein